MIDERSKSFWVSSITNDTPLPVPSVSDLLERVQSSPVWDGTSIAPFLVEKWDEYFNITD